MTHKEKVLNRLKNRIDQGKSIKNKDMLEEDSSLLHALAKYGGMTKMCKELGITEDQLIKVYGLTNNINPRTLSKDEILVRLKYLKSIGKLTTTGMRTQFEDLRLETSIKKLYGNVKNGLVHFNMESDRVRVSEKSLTKDILDADKSGIDLTYTSMMETNSKLLNNSVNVFGKGWYSLLDDLGIEYTAIRKKYTEESILERVQIVKNKAGVINYRTLQIYDASIIQYAHIKYGSIIDFYIAIGLNPDDCMDFSKQTVKGFAFERVYRKLLDILQQDYIFNKQFCDGIRPDFQLSDNMWVDCKLSAWTKSIEDTINRYTEHCEKLVIVFLRGEYKHLPEIDNSKVEFRKIDYYYPFLRQINRLDLIEEFENIKNNDTFLPTVTTERLIS